MRKSSILLDKAAERSCLNQNIHLKKYIIVDLIFLFFLVLCGVLIGIFWQQWLWIGIFAVVVFLCWQLLGIYQAIRWIRNHHSYPLPKIMGVIGAWLSYFYNQNYQYDVQVKKELIAFTKRMQSSLIALEEAVVLIDEQHRLEWWNPAAEILLGLEDGDHHRLVLDVITHAEFQHYFKSLDDFSDGIIVESALVAERYTEIKITRFGYDSRLLIAHDVTRIRNLEQMRKDFVDNISHELRTPLTVLSGYLETLSESDDMPRRWRRAFDQMQQQTRRMNALVHDLLLLSHLENQSLHSKNQIIHMAELMNQLFDDAQGYNTEYAHTLNLNLESHHDLIGSDMELASAFGNLITNAIKYTPPHGTITISWQDQDDKAVFSVQDNGIGIDRIHQPRLTERFYRVDSGRSRETGGTGLGLAIVKHVLAQHDARLEIESELHQGSTFKAIFPKHRLHNAGNLPEQQWADS